MKLNPNCIRDIMCFLEERTKVTFQDIGGHKISTYYELCPALFQQCDQLKHYELTEIFYHIVQLSEAGYISTDYKFDRVDGDGRFRLSRVHYVTPKGHEFTASLKDSNTWKEKILPVLKGMGTVSLSIIEAVASGATSAIISRFLPGLEQP